MSSSSSMTPFTRGHHTTKRFNNAARLKTATHYPIITTPIISNPDINNNSNNPGAVFAHYEHGHSDSLLEILNDLRLSRQLCDITIIVDQHEYPCHKCHHYINKSKQLSSNHHDAQPKLIPLTLMHH
ncbi:unnamed protein product [Rotaria sordida]|uniref:Uncharacterized protein n=1 Tax=Rotaria sordida TaxID=392033 RepID=A0A814H7V7_9BILA|nr:unnamed protein product [Rotaria sordida]